MNYAEIINDYRFANFLEFLEDDLYRHHQYKLVSIDATNEGVLLVITTDKDAEYMPTIHALGEAGKNGYIWWGCTMFFPELSVQDYYDSIEHWVHEWQDAAKICTLIQKEALDLDSYDLEE